ncbi:MAG TPA: hypothetical protein VKR53_11655 [Puia sp.]|nr:hypothetical protein [Puia sp.]
MKKINEAKKLVEELHLYFPGSKINFDLQDCDRVLRIDGYSNIAADVIRTLQSNGFMCAELE